MCVALFGKRGVFAKKKNRCLPPLCPAIERVPGRNQSSPEEPRKCRVCRSWIPGKRKSTTREGQYAWHKKRWKLFREKKMKKVFRFFKPKKRSAWFLRRVLTSSKPPQTRMVRNKKVVPFFCLYARVPFRLPVQPLPRPRSSDLDPKASSIGLRPPRLPRWTDAASRHVTHLTVPRINQGLAIDVIARVLYVYVCMCGL